MFTVSNSRILKLIVRQKASWFDQFVVKEPLFIIILPSTNTSDTKKKQLKTNKNVFIVVLKLLVSISI